MCLRTENGTVWTPSRLYTSSPFRMGGMPAQEPVLLDPLGACFQQALETNRCTACWWQSCEWGDFVGTDKSQRDCLNAKRRRHFLPSRAEEGSVHPPDTQQGDGKISASLREESEMTACRVCNITDHSPSCAEGLPHLSMDGNGPRDRLKRNVF